MWFCFSSCCCFFWCFFFIRFPRILKSSNKICEFLFKIITDIQCEKYLSPFSVCDIIFFFCFPDLKVKCCFQCICYHFVRLKISLVKLNGDCFVVVVVNVIFLWANLFLFSIGCAPKTSKSYTAQVKYHSQKHTKIRRETNFRWFLFSFVFQNLKYFIDLRGQ